MFCTRLKSFANHSPNELKRSGVALVEATKSQKSGSRKYAKNASMNSSDANDQRRPRRPRRRPILDRGTARSSRVPASPAMSSSSGVEPVRAN
jgi:hypothetical protein